jgi:hypothetical protein
MAGLAVFALADVASGVSNNATLLVAARLAGGVGGGGGLAMSISFAVFAVTRPERGIALWSIGQLVFGSTWKSWGSGPVLRRRASR